MVWCPLCSKSLMDPEILVDKKPGIKLDISSNDEKGTINISSLYGSYHYKTDFNIIHNTEYKFNCSSCNQNITSSIKCDECSATMIPLNIEGIGNVRFCSRAGCKNHNIEVDDVKDLEYFALKKELLKSGTFLRTFCPHCTRSNAEGNVIKFKITNKDDKKGDLMLSPYLNVFTNKSTIDLPEGEVVKDIACPNCDTSLIVKDKNCEECYSQVVKLHVAAVSKLIDFYFCSKKGCQWHGLSGEDIEYVLLEDSDAW